MLYCQCYENCLLAVRPRESESFLECSVGRYLKSSPSLSFWEWSVGQKAARFKHTLILQQRYLTFVSNGPFDGLQPQISHNQCCDGYHGWPLAKIPGNRTMCVGGLRLTKSHQLISTKKRRFWAGFSRCRFFSSDPSGRPCSIHPLPHRYHLKTFHYLHNNHHLDLLVPVITAITLETGNRPRIASNVVRVSSWVCDRSVLQADYRLLENQCGIRKCG
jgi:hypothetical protein